MTTPSDPESAHRSPGDEFPDEAGYPDGTGTLNEGLDLDSSDAGEVTGLDEFLDEDARDEEE